MSEALYSLTPKLLSGLLALAAIIATIVIASRLRAVRGEMDALLDQLNQSRRDQLRPLRDRISSHAARSQFAARVSGGAAATILLLWLFADSSERPQIVNAPALSARPEAEDTAGTEMRMLHSYYQSRIQTARDQFMAALKGKDMDQADLEAYARETENAYAALEAEFEEIDDLRVTYLELLKESHEAQNFILQELSATQEQLAQREQEISAFQAAHLDFEFGLESVIEKLGADAKESELIKFTTGDMGRDLWLARRRLAAAAEEAEGLQARMDEIQVEQFIESLSPDALPEGEAIRTFPDAEKPLAPIATGEPQ